MAKGLGAIMAEVRMAEDRCRISELKDPACPLCGEPMEYNGVAWFCISSQDENCPKMDKLEKLMYATAGRDYISQGGHLDQFQFQVFAAVVVDSEPLVEFMSMRGFGGRTTLRVGKTLDADIDDANVPALIAQHGWTWYDWAYPMAHDKGGK